MEIGPWKYSGEALLLLVQTLLKSWGGSVCWGHGGLKLKLTVILRLSRSLRDSATQDTDKPEFQPVSESESLHSCVLSCVRVGQA